MNDDAAFTAALVADPNDDATRLVYADWLEERGDVRGEFLRLQHQLASVLERIQHVRPQVETQWANSIAIRPTWLFARSMPISATRWRNWPGCTPA